MATLLGDGIFAVDGPQWHVQRKAAAKIFHVNFFRDHMVFIFHAHLRTVSDILLKGPVDFHELMHRFTLDSFTEMGFGESIHSLTNKDHSFREAFDSLQTRTNLKFIYPPPLLWLKDLFSGDLGKDALYGRTLNAFAYNIIEKRLQKPSDGNDLLCHFMRMKKEDGTQYDTQDLRHIVMNFIIAGRDTTAQALSWTVYELQKRPDIVKKMREEFKATCLDPLAPSYDELKSMSYTTSVFLECLRLHPSVPKNMKYAVSDDILPDGTKIKKGW